ncbi:MAG: EAL domain-containing protein [Burkholderiales bacterium]|nr:EAL domain-containing protein [Burkholderiales bacterium]
MWQVEVKEARELVRTKANARVQELTVAIQHRMAAYEQVLLGGASLIATVGTLSRDQWHNYVKHLKVSEHYPGFQGIGYAEYVRPADKAAFVQAQQRQGLNDYAIRPPGERAAYGPVTYLEPRSERNLKAHGFDMLSEPNRRTAMEAARDTGQPAITGKLKLASEAANSASFGFLLYVPVYRGGAVPDSVDERRALIKGFVNSPFRMEDLLKNALGRNPDGLRLRVYDGPVATPDNLMYTSESMVGPAGGDHPSATVPPLHIHSTVLGLHGRVWLMECELPHHHTAAIENTPEDLVPLAGLVISLLLTALTWVAMARLQLVRQSARHYHALANFDPLTALSNRTKFQDSLEESVREAGRTGERFALLFIDLDHFKDINDTLGHQWGDKLLQQVAQRLKDGTRSADTVSRLGGDEFTVILRDMKDSESATRVAQTLLEALAKPYELEGEAYFVSASMGITLFPHDAQTSADLLKTADQAMYTAKRLGRNRHQLFSPDMVEGNQHRLRMIADLRMALEHHEFHLVYQPIVDMATRRIAKAEALIRWQSPKHGLVGPVDFIALAEDTGLIIGLGDWVFNEATRQVADWRRRFAPDFQISINVSPAQLKRPDGDLRHWIATLQAQGLPGQAIGLEITEGLLLDINLSVTQQLLSLRDAGIPVALDDFGTGYSSLSYLRKLDIDYLKIDQSFVGTLKPDSDELALCAAIIVMAHKLGLKVVAEGVETQEQCDLLLAAGCDFGQGYLFSRPVKPADFEALLQTA